MFTSPETGSHYRDLRGAFANALEAAKLAGTWFHDLRRSLVTLSRHRGTPESLVMRIGGRRTMSVFDRYNIVSEDDLRVR